MSDVAIGTHYFDLKRISNEQDGDRGEEGGGEDQDVGTTVIVVVVVDLTLSRIFTNLRPCVDQPVRLCPKLFIG